MKIYVVIATYNERENIETLVPNVLALRDDMRVVIVDDASPDGTGESAEKLAAQSDRVDVIHRTGKLGLGAALKAGMKYAVAHGAEIVATMDADHSHAPEYLPGMIELTEGYAIVVGSRYIPGGGVRNWDTRRVVLSKCANFYARTMAAVKVKDCTSGYRTYRRDFLIGMDFDKIQSIGYSFLVEILMLAQKGGFPIMETPIVFVDRIKGQSKINLEEVIRGAWSLFISRMKNA